MAVFSRLLPTVMTAYTVQALAALIFVPQQQDKFYDFTGMLGFLSSTFISLYYPALKATFWYNLPDGIPNMSSFSPRQLLLNAALGIWSLRLGTFLLRRALKHGGDSRFDEIKKQPRRFTYFWFAQGTWTILVGLPVYLANILPVGYHTPLGSRDYISLAIFASSFALEMLADYQKSTWRSQKIAGLHNEKFIKSGLWSLSRHPKWVDFNFSMGLLNLSLQSYVGEVGIWTGIWALASMSLQHPFFPRITPAVAAISPLFTWFLVRHVSGVPPLERSAEKKFSDDPEWKAYKRNVPMFWPWGSPN